MLWLELGLKADDGVGLGHAKTRSTGVGALVTHTHVMLVLDLPSGTEWSAVEPVVVVDAARRLALAALLLWIVSARAPLPPRAPWVVTPEAAFRRRPPLPAAGAQQPQDRTAKLDVSSAELSSGMTVWLAPRRSLPDVSLRYVARDAGTLDADELLELLELLRLTMRTVVEGVLLWSDGQLK